jgi:hypothetical protein
MSNLHRMTKLIKPHRFVWSGLLGAWAPVSDFSSAWSPRSGDHKSESAAGIVAPWPVEHGHAESGVNVDSATTEVAAGLVHACATQAAAKARQPQTETDANGTRVGRGTRRRLPFFHRMSKKSSASIGSQSGYDTAALEQLKREFLKNAQVLELSDEEALQECRRAAVRPFWPPRLPS